MNSLFSDCHVGNLQVFTKLSFFFFFCSILQPETEFCHNFEFCVISVKPLSCWLMSWQAFVSLTNQIILNILTSALIGPNYHVGWWSSGNWHIKFITSAYKQWCYETLSSNSWSLPCVFTFTFLSACNGIERSSSSRHTIILVYIYI